MMTELLSPAGNFEALRAAVQSGADAVYMGYDKFSARASAGNFDREQIQEAIAYCHIRGVKVHITLNTLIKQSELEEALECASFLYRAGADAVIVQDIGLAAAIKEQMPLFPLHASTQMTIVNLDGARAAKLAGFERAVLARELSKKEIEYIDKNTDIQLEVFAHGALCECYSGQCLLSSMIDKRSGNRGRCAQPCRLFYELYLKSGEKIASGHLMSPKDLCLASRLGEMKKVGADSYKLEGRLKKAAYVATVTKVYSELLKSGKMPTKEQNEALLNAFSRSGFTGGYFEGRLGADMMCYSDPSNTASEKFEKGIENVFSENANFRKIPVYAHAHFRFGERVSFKLTYENIQAEVFSDAFEYDERTNIDAERLERQLSKMGNTVFETVGFSSDSEDEFYYPISALNELRRSACALLEDKIINSYKRELPNKEIKVFKPDLPKKTSDVSISVSVTNTSQAYAALSENIKRIYAPKEIIKKIVCADKDRIFVTYAPEIISDISMKDYFSDIETEEVLFSNIGGICGAKKFRASADFRFNVYNAETVKVLKKFAFSSVTLSPELSLREIADIGALLDECEVIAYGRIPLMLIKNCIIKAAGGKCRKGESLIMKDRKNEKFLLSCRPDMCINTLYNSKPLYMADKLSEMKKSGIKNIRLAFTDEDEAETKRVIKAYKDAAAGDEYNIFGENKFTRGHFFREVL